jgi:hypothetical protein
MKFRRNNLVQPPAMILLLLALAHPAHAAGFDSSFTSPLASIAAAGENTFAKLMTLIEPHHVVTIHISPATWHATGASQSAAAFNAAVTTSTEPSANNTDEDNPVLPSVAGTRNIPTGATPSSALAALSPAVATQYVTQADLAAAICTGAYGMTVVGRYAYIACPNDNAVKVVDISDPYNMTFVGSTQGTNLGTSLQQVYGMAASGRYLYVVDRTQAKLVTLDISDPTNPTELSEVSLPSSGGAPMRISATTTMRRSLLSTLAAPISPTYQRAQLKRPIYMSLLRVSLIRA